MTELNNCCGTTCDKSALAEEITQLRQVAADRTKEAEIAKRSANELQQRNAELAAQVEQLRGAITKDVIDLVRCGIGSNYGGDKYFDAIDKYKTPLIDALAKTQAQCLAEHDREVAARAVESAIKSLRGNVVFYVSDLQEYANKLRQGEVDI